MAASKSVYDNRELSWLKFNDRVLAEAQDARNPLCERLSFVSIFQSNLDEFIMVRVGALQDGVNSTLRDNKTNLTCAEQLARIRREERSLLAKRDRVYASLMRRLASRGVKNLSFADLNDRDKEHVTNIFRNEVKPFLSPQIVGKRQPFPFLKNEAIYAVVELESKKSEAKLGIVPCVSDVTNRVVHVGQSGRKFMLLEELILHFVQDIFEHYTVKSKSLIRVIRSADIDLDELEDYGTDYRSSVEEALKVRTRLAPLELDFSRDMEEPIVERLCGYLNVSRGQVFRFASPFNPAFLSDVQDMLRSEKELFFPRRTPQDARTIRRDASVTAQVRARDRLLFFPYESIRPFLTLLGEAARDPRVVSIKITLYRVAQNSKIIEALMDASENGKEVVVLVELRARFDEENNIRWSRELEDAGCNVIYGLNHLKVHSKLCLITRRGEAGNIEYITQIGTGNYNEKTSTLYTDYSLMTADARIGADAAKVFNALAFGETVDDAEHLLVAPNALMNKIIAMIDEQIALAKSGGNGYIGLKINSLTDRVIIDKLLEASRAGVKIQMVVRGICCLNPGIPGKSDNIEVRSIVGRFLEHSRIYIFGRGSDQKVYIASADFMTRNTTHRVEVAAPIYDPDVKARIVGDFALYLKDNVKARVNQGGVYKRVKPAEGEAPFNAQEYFYARAYGEIASPPARDASTDIATSEAAGAPGEGTAQGTR